MDSNYPLVKLLRLTEFVFASHLIRYEPVNPCRYEGCRASCDRSV